MTSCARRTEALLAALKNPAYRFNRMLNRALPQRLPIGYFGGEAFTAPDAANSP